MWPDGTSGFPPDVAIQTARQQLTIAVYFNQRPPAPKAMTVGLGHAESTAIGLRCSESSWRVGFGRRPFQFVRKRTDLNIDSLCEARNQLEVRKKVTRVPGGASVPRTSEASPTP